MVKTRQSNRSKKKKESSSQGTSSSHSRKTQKSKRKTRKNSKKKASTPKSHDFTTSSSETSPFKGYELLEVIDLVEAEKAEEPKLFGSLIDDDVSVAESKDDIFDRLVDEDLPINLNRNIRTYANKKKVNGFREHPILEFQDCRNRNDIIQWLNDNRNVFDRLTQTQTECVVNPDTDTQLTLDLPSVSQQNTPKVEKPRKEIRRRVRSPYKLRAKSLDIQIKKNLQIGRNRSYSLAGDSPLLENYHIEEVVTDEDAPVPADKDKIVVDYLLMENECLDNIEQMLRNDDKKNQSGWDRIKDINKTIKSTKKQPKQLKITLQSNEKKGANLTDDDNNVPCYYDAMEIFFIENMEKLLQDEKDISSRSNGSNNSNRQFSVKNAIQMGKNFLTVIKKVVENEGKECLKELHPLMFELKKFVDVPVKESATQTRNILNLEKYVQTERNTVNMITQTERNVIHRSVQTEDNQETLKTVERNIEILEKQTEDIGVQTEDIGVQTDGTLNVSKTEGIRKLLDKQTSDATSATPSDIFADDREKQEMQDAFEEDFFNEETTKEAEQKDVFDDDLNFDVQNEDAVENTENVEQEKEVFDDGFNFDFNTEDILKNELKLDGNEGVGRPKTGESVLVVSTEPLTENKGIKRHSESPVDLEEFPPKRPCAKFINQDLSIAFSSCDKDEDRDVRKEAIEVIELSEESYNEEDIRKIMKMYESSAVANPKAKPKTRTQEQIEALENMIYNATKPSRPVEVGKTLPSHESLELEDDLDYFKPAEKTPKTVRRNLFNSSNDKVRTSPNVFSESLFGDRNVTVVTNRTITEDNVDVIVQENKKSSAVFDSDADREVRDIFKDRKVKVNILENVVLREGDKGGAKIDGNLSETSDVFSDVDVVESTPQKKRSPRASDEREEGVLDITLPPPLEFQDSERQGLDLDTSKILSTQRIYSPPRRPLAVINKITSTPLTQKPDSENFLSLSPISGQAKKPKLSLADPKSKSENSIKKTVSNRENIRNPGPFEFAQQQLSKCSPLTVIKKPQSQESCRLSSTPKQKSILNFVRPSQESPSQKSDSGKRKPCIACSRVSRDQVIAISTLTNRKLATYSTSFSPNVTHLIVSTNEKNCLKDHTIKFVSAVAAGVWVLSFEWIRQCLRKNALVPEEPFEVLDVSGVPGPRQARLTRSTNPLFRGFKMHAAAPFASTTQQEVENVIRMLGGKVVPSPENLLDKNGYVCVVVTEARATQDFELYETWLEALKVVTVDIEWLSRSVGQYKLLSLRPFTLCSDDGIENLGYPSELTVNMTYSFSQQTFSSVPSST